MKTKVERKSCFECFEESRMINLMKWSTSKLLSDEDLHSQAQIIASAKCYYLAGIQLVGKNTWKITPYGNFKNMRQFFGDWNLTLNVWGLSLLLSLFCTCSSAVLILDKLLSQTKQRTLTPFHGDKIRSYIKYFDHIRSSKCFIHDFISIRYRFYLTIYIKSIF